VTILLFLSLNLILFLSSRGLLVAFKIFTKKNYVVDTLQISGVPLYIFYPILTFFIIGNTSVLLNFFLPIKNLQFFWLMLLIVFLTINLREPISFQNNIFLISSLLVIPAIMSISSYGLKFHYDAIDNHLNYQYWIRESKIVFGLSNLYIAYGWSNIYEYILSNFWINDRFIGLHFVNIIFFTFFYNFIFYNLAFSKNLFLKYLSINITIYSFLDNFGVNGGANGFVNIQMIGKPDEAVGIMFFVSFIMVLNDYLKNSFSVNNFLFYCTISLFTFQLKINSALLIIPLLIYLFKLKKYNFTRMHKLYFTSLIFTSLMYFLKNLFISGCLIFPVSQTCVDNLSWTDAETVEKFSLRVLGENNALLLQDNFHSWFINWINSAYNFQIYTNLIISLLIIWIFNKLVYKKNTHKSSRSEKISFLLIIFIVISFFITGPTLRYGFGVFLILISSFSIKIKTPKNSNYFRKTVSIVSFILFLSVGLTPRIYSYKGFFANPFNLIEINNNTEEYLNLGTLKNLEVNNVEGSICYIPKSCIRNSNYKSIIYFEFYEYKLYKYSLN
jgi:hypothetical protein